MARDDSGERLLRGVLWMSLLDRTRPTSTLEWVSPVIPVITHAAVGAGHWGAGRRQRALAEWASAAGFALVAWGRGTEAPTPAEARENIERQKDLWRARGLQVPATAGTTPAARRLERYFPALEVAGMVFGVRSGLRNPRRLTVLAVINEALGTWSYVLGAPQAVQRCRPRIAVGSALVVAGAVARLRAAAAEPLR